MKEIIYSTRQMGKTIQIINITICGITNPHKNYEIQRPLSDTACIEYIEKGRGTVIIGDKKFYPSEGDSYFLHEGLNQHYWSDPKNPWKKYFINISGSLLSSMTDGYNLIGHYYFKGLNLKEELLKIIEIVKNNDTCYEAKIIGIINEILLKMHKHIYSSNESLSVHQRIKHFLNTMVEKKFKMQDLCDNIHISESQIRKIFQQKYGTSPYSYVMDKKINYAKILLNNTSLSIKEISDKLCFADQYHFSNIFKEKAGIAPKNYRNLKRGCKKTPDHKK